MPIFTYECQECGNVFDIFFKTNNINNKEEHCAECDSYDVIKYIGRSSFILKGSGWARDGYSSKNNTQESNVNTLTRIPQISDKNGNVVGAGKPETIIME